VSDVRVVTIAERPDLVAAAEEVNLQGWPEFMFHDPVAGVHFGKLYDWFPEYQFVLVDSDERVLVSGDAIPFRWDARIDQLPDRGWDFVLEQGVADREAGREPNIVSAIQVVVRGDLLGTGFARRGLDAMRGIATAAGIADLVAPVRPNAKHRYPLTPMERYVVWTRDDGTPFDPWMRVHHRAGAQVVGVCSRSMTITGSVQQWSRWTDMAFPDSGQYVVPGALVPVEIDRNADAGTYVEPNVWMHHRLT